MSSTMGLNWIEFHLANQLLAVSPPIVNLEVNFSFNSFHGPTSCASYQKKKKKHVEDLQAIPRESGCGGKLKCSTDAAG